MMASDIDPDPGERTRIDKWLWAARFFKTRSLAAQAVEGGKVRLNDERVKPAKSICAGDRLTIRIGAYDWALTVCALSDKRGPAEAACKLYREDDASREKRSSAVAARRAGMDPEPQHGGRPEKKQRRALQRLRGY
jgi:ribosome-associated heat shock protein Hsp15